MPVHLRVRPPEGMRCRNRAIEGIGYCNIHKDKVPTRSAGSMRCVSCYLGGGVGFSNKTIVHALLADQRERTDAIARTLYAQFPTTMDRDIHTDLWYDVKRAGFSPRDVPARYIKGRLVRGKNDHRHWMDSELGVSPHTAKLAIVDGRTYQMGKCLLEIKE